MKLVEKVERAFLCLEFWSFWVGEPMIHPSDGLTNLFFDKRYMALAV